MSQLLPDVPENGGDIISPTCFEKLCCSSKYTLTGPEFRAYNSLQSSFSSSNIDKEELYQSIKTFADKVFQGDDDYNELINRDNEEEIRRKLLNYMGFMFEDVSNDLKGIENIAIQFFNYSITKDDFVGIVRNIFESPKILFGQTIRTIIYNLKLYMYLDSDREKLEHKQKGISVKMGRKEMKNFAQRLVNFNDNPVNLVFDIVCQLFTSFKNDNLIQNIEIGNPDYWNIVNKAIINAINRFHSDLSKDQRQIEYEL